MGDLLNWAISDQKVIGIVAWVSLIVTISGFWVAITQIRKVKRASQAANEAIAQLVKVVRSQQQSARIASALSHLTSAQAMMKKHNSEASSAHLSVGWDALIAARELTDNGVDRQQISEFVVLVRRLLDDSNAPGADAIPSQKLQVQRHTEINKTLAGLGILAARLDAALSGIGVSP